MRLLFLLFILALPAQAEKPKLPAPCASLDACLAQMKQLAAKPGDSYDSYTDDEEALLKRTLAFDSAVPSLVELLADPNERLANLAAKGLREAKSIDPVYLPQVIAGLDRGLDWLAPALGRMDDDRAAREAVARFLVSESAPRNQEAYAVELSGHRAIPFLVDAARCSKPCGERDHYYLAQVLGEMKQHRALAAPGLMAIAEDDAASEQAAGGALQMVAELQADGLPLEQRLLALRERKPSLAHEIDEALVGIGSDRAGAIFVERLRISPNIHLLADLARTGAASKSAGPLLVELLNHVDWDTRLGAARAMGYVEYADGATALIPLLQETGDVRLNWVAAESLGRLRAPEARPALERAAQTHWFPPVRSAAQRALAERIVPAVDPASEYRLDLAVPHEFFAHQALSRDMPACKRPAVSVQQEARTRKLRIERDADRLAKMGYTATVVGFGPAVEASSVEGSSKVIELSPGNIVEHRNAVSQVPQVALRVDGGWLVGSSRGEWGGELVFLGDDGANQTILEENVEDIYSLGSRIVAVTGLAHMGINNGMLYDLTRVEQSRWNARPWRSLPGAPHSSGLVSSEEVMVSVGRGVFILVSSDGVMRMAPCAEYEPLQ